MKRKRDNKNPRAWQYREAYFILMDYWDSLPDDEKPEINKRLEEVGL